MDEDMLDANAERKLPEGPKEDSKECLEESVAESLREEWVTASWMDDSRCWANEGRLRSAPA